MLETTLITFREGLEAFLIVAIMLAYLTKTGKAHLTEPVYWGVGVAIPCLWLFVGYVRQKYFAQSVFNAAE